ncbi:MAG: hypothetical protein M3Q47_13900 [Actinomycetota bacterium]|nr:hypothetical protein [Actinomycetota bacterium]
MRRTVRDAGLDAVWAQSLTAGEAVPADLPLPAVVKPRSGVASEDVYLARSAEEVARRVAEVAARRPGTPVLVEEYLDGPCTPSRPWATGGSCGCSAGSAPRWGIRPRSWSGDWTGVRTCRRRSSSRSSTSSPRSGSASAPATPSSSSCTAGHGWWRSTTG